MFVLRTKSVNVKLHLKICKDPNKLEGKIHLLQSKILKEETGETNFNDVYSNVEKQLKAVRTFKRILRRRKVYLEINP